MKPVRIFLCTITFAMLIGTLYGQEFPIAVGSDAAFGGGAAFDGAKFLFAIQGDAANRYNITAQFVSLTGSLIGPRITLGQTGSSPIIQFDGTNFLVAWTDSFPTFGSGDTSGIGNVYGQFIDTSGTPVGSPFTMATSVNVKWGKGRGGLAVQDTTYFLTYLKGPDHHSEYIYGQRLNRSGAPVGSPIQISETYAREPAVAFDGTNYLVVWCKVEHPNPDRYIYGQFVTASGALVGGNFLIDAGDQASDNPISMIFDGTRFWVGFHELAADTTGRWNLFGRFVSTTGVPAERFMICDSTKSPTFTSAAFDGTRYLITWVEFAGSIRIRARVFDASGDPVDSAFTAFGTVEEKFPIGGVGGFVDGRFVLSATRLNHDMSEGDIYGLFLPATTTEIRDMESGVHPGEFSLSQNYPNPFNPTTRISFSLKTSGFISLKVYDLLGREVATLIDGEVEAGTRTVEFEALGLSSGVYFYQLRAGAFVQVRKMALVK